MPNVLLIDRYYPLKLLFDTQNIKEVWICCTKKRENHGRRQIWLMFISMCVMVAVGFTKFSILNKIVILSILI